MNKTNHQPEFPLFEKIGGMPAVTAAVDIFYARVQSDPRVNHYFRWIDMDRQSMKLQSFLAYAFGAPLTYTGASMRLAHAHLVNSGLNQTHFDAVMEHLSATMNELGIDPELIDNVLTIAESTRSDILGLT
ncbi:MAG: group I truncated hemoglobin [Candidatus Cyclobacteriaceae bacterium M3_2C_046]